jgi:hypothetical protein
MPLVHTPEAANEKEAVASTKVRVERKCMTPEFREKKREKEFTEQVRQNNDSPGRLGSAYAV